MAERRRLGVQDVLWLEMDRPGNLMVVDSVVWTATPVDWDRFRKIARERLWDRYPVFRSIPVRGDDGAWYWEVQPDADLEAHVEHVTLEGPDEECALRDLVGSQRTVPLPRDTPLWRVFLVDGYKGGSAMVLRTHHAIADGIRMVQLAMSLFDAAPEGGPIVAPAVHMHNATPKAPGQPIRHELLAPATWVAEEVSELAGEMTSRVGEVATNPMGVATRRLGAIGHLVGRGTASAVSTSRGLAAQAVTNPVGAAHGAASIAATTVGSAGSLLRSSVDPRSYGGPLADVLAAAPGDVDIARKLLVGTRNDATCWTGTVGDHKAVAWSAPLPLVDVIKVAHSTGSTVNDVLVTCVAGTLRAYLVKRHALCASVNWMIPVNLKPIDTTLPEELGNDFAIVQLELPTNIADPLAVLDVVRHRMNRIKNGHEAVVAFGIQAGLAKLSKTVYRASVDLLANRAVGVLTNVPGPPMPVYLAGQKVAGIVGWAPLSGNQPMSFTIYSYDGKVFVGIACDADLVPDHEQIVDGFADAFQRLSVVAL